MKTKTPKITMTIIVLLILVLGVVLALDYKIKQTNKQLGEQNIFYKKILLIQSKSAEGYDFSEKANYYYDLASQEYSLQEHNSSISNCELSRDYSTKYMQSLREEKAAVKDYKEVIFVPYNNLLDSAIEVYSNLYEACEFMETADRQYESGNYVAGGNSIDLLNERIVSHDNAVEKYNQYLAEYTIELGKLSNE